MPVRRDDLRVRDVRSLSTSAFTISRERAGAKRQSVVNETTRKRQVAGDSACARSPPVGSGRIEVVEGLGDAQVRVRVVILGELLTLMAQVRLDLELGLERELEAFAQRAAELLLHLLVGQVSDVADHARDDEPSPRLRPLRLEVAVVKIGIRADRLPRDFVEGDVLRGKIRRRGDHQRVADALGIARRPGERLHSAEAAAHHRRPLADAEAGRRASPARPPSLRR